MRTLVVALIGVVAFASGVMLGFELDRDARVVQVEQPQMGDVVEGPPRQVWLTRSQLQLAAESGDYEKLRALIPDAGFEYTFGGPVEGGPIAYWQGLESERPPIEILAQILRMPYTLSRGYYVWPFAYDVASIGDLSPHERELLEPLGPLDSLFFAGTGYLGWRAGIAPDGSWAFFVAGD